MLAEIYLRKYLKASFAGKTYDHFVLINFKLSLTSNIVLFFCSLFLLSSCQTIENKSQQAINKENKKLSKFLQQPESELKIVMGEPDEITYDDKGSKLFIYISKKYNITCKREFEINENKMVVAFSHKGCF